VRGAGRGPGGRGSAVFWCRLAWPAGGGALLALDPACMPSGPAVLLGWGVFCGRKAGFVCFVGCFGAGAARGQQLRGSGSAA